MLQYFQLFEWQEVPMGTLADGLLKVGLVSREQSERLACQKTLLRSRALGIAEERAITERAIKKGQGHMGATTTLLSASAQLTMSAFIAFCERTPNGPDFWVALQEKKSASSNPDVYGVLEYAYDILSTAHSRP